MSEKKRGGGLDEASREMIFNGVNLSELGRIFRMDHRGVVEKLHGIPPSGKRHNAGTYLIHEVAPYLVKPIFDIEEYVKRMNHTDLPKQVSKEFWAGLRARQEYRIKEGELWETEAVIKAVGELLKLVKMSMKLMSDAVERETELTDRQRDRIRQLTDAMLIDLRARVIDDFTGEDFNEVAQEDESDI